MTRNDRRLCEGACWAALGLLLFSLIAIVITGLTQ